jgi:hypothetical protein
VGTVSFRGGSADLAPSSLPGRYDGITLMVLTAQNLLIFA